MVEGKGWEELTVRQVKGWEVAEELTVRQVQGNMIMKWCLC